MRKLIGFTAIITVFVFASLTQAQEPQSPADGVRTASVKEMLIAGSYVYLLVIEEGEEVWLATAPGFVKDIGYGDVVEFVGELEMRDFHSNGLNRTFASLWFVSRIRVKQVDAIEGGAEEQIL